MAILTPKHLLILIEAYAYCRSHQPRNEQYELEMIKMGFVYYDEGILRNTGKGLDAMNKAINCLKEKG